MLQTFSFEEMNSKKKPKGTLTGHLEFYIHLQQSGVAVKVRD